jgi:hypothetical protein
VLGMRLADLEDVYQSAPPRFDLMADVAPLPPRHEVLQDWRPNKSCSSGGCCGCGSSCSTKAGIRHDYLEPEVLP